MRKAVTAARLPIRTIYKFMTSKFNDLKGLEVCTQHCTSCGAVWAAAQGSHTATSSAPLRRPPRPSASRSSPSTTTAFKSLRLTSPIGALSLPPVALSPHNSLCLCWPCSCKP